MTNSSSFIHRTLFLIFSILIFTQHSCSPPGEEAIAEEPARKPYDTNLIAMVMENDKYGYVNPYGEYVIPAQFDRAMPFSEGIACVGKKNGNGYSFFFIDKKGNKVMDAGISAAAFFREGYAATRSGSRVCFIDTSGNKIGNYQLANNFREGLALVMDKKDNVGYVDSTGNFKIKLRRKTKFQEAKNFSEGRAAVLYKIPVKKGHSLTRDRWGYIDTDGTQKIKPEYVLAYEYSDGYARVRKGSKFGFIDPKGNDLNGFAYKDAGDFSDGIAFVKKDDNYGYMDTTGNMVVDYQYYRVKNFGNGLAPVMKKYKKGKYNGYYWGYINSKNEWITDPIYNEAYPFENGFGMVKVSIKEKGRKTLKIGFLDTDGDTAIAPKFDKAHSFVYPDSTNEIKVYLTPML